MINNNSILFILKYKHRNSIYSLLRYFIWQIIKALKLFPRIVCVSNSKFLIKNIAVANQGGTKLYTCGIYDYDNIMFIKDYYKKFKGSFFDVGSNIGVYSVLISEEINVNIYAFEPHPETYTLLKENLKINLRNNVYAENVALGNYNGIVHFSNSPYSSVNKVMINSGSDGITVNHISLDEFIFINKIIPDIVKIDVEGYEAEVIEGLKNNISSIKFIFVETNESNKIIAMLNHSFDGPYYINFKNKNISTQRHHHEDPVFINRTFKAKVISEMNFQII